MKKKAIIFDLDNTIYSSYGIGDKVFESLFKLIESKGGKGINMDQIKMDVMSKPFQVVADQHKLDNKLKEECINLLKDLEYNGQISPFEDFALVHNLNVDKYLVTTGFTKLQQSKIRGLQLNQHFQGIYVVDPMLSSKTKKDIFEQIMQDHALTPEHVLVVGDDPDSEIKAGKALGIDTLLYDKEGKHQDASGSCISNYKDLPKFL